MTEMNLADLVCHLKVNKAVQLDYIRPRDIKLHIERLKPVLLKLYHSIFASGVIPRTLETATVRSI